mmetsp:Transcript_29565/g.48210  ORF Transcript_29565/g.48210 Transcript_29565/m.48210 type:complete len:336 (+) Transcript_29565:204-1211(+)
MESNRQTHVEKIYSTVSVIILGGALICFAVSFFVAIRKRQRLLAHPVSLAVFLLLLPNSVMALVYFCEHLYNILTGERLSGGPMCQLVAFGSICSIVSIMGCSVVVAYASHQAISQGKVCDSARRVVVIGSALSWLAGLVVGGGYQAAGMMGPYERLYCCVSDEGITRTPILVAVFIFFIAVIAQLQYYCRIYIKFHSSQAKERRLKGSLREAVVWGLENILLFYVGWCRMAINMISAFNGHDVGQWAAIFAAWLAKFHALLCGITFLLHFGKKMKTEDSTGAALLKAEAPANASHQEKYASHNKKVLFAGEEEKISDFEKLPRQLRSGPEALQA